jgi:hypothetical protein
LSGFPTRKQPEIHEKVIGKKKLENACTFKGGMDGKKNSGNL